MGYDPFSPISPACVNVLLLPAGKIRAAKFSELASKIEKQNIVHLEDVGAAPSPQSANSSPGSHHRPGIIFDISTADGAAPQVDSFPFELNREPQIILAVADGQAGIAKDSSEIVEGNFDESQSQSSFTTLLKIFQDTKDQYGPKVLSLLILFDGNTSTELSGEVLSVSTSLEDASISDRVMQIVAARFVQHLDQVVKNFQNVTIPGPAIKRSASINVNKDTGAPSNRQLRTRNADSVISSGRNGLPDPYESSQLTTDEPRDLVVDDGGDEQQISDSKAYNSDRNSIAISTQAIATEAQKIQSRTRYQILVGASYLQSGQWSYSLPELAQGAIAARSSSVDDLWYAKALEYILVGMILLSSAGIEFVVPQVCYHAISKESSTKSTYSVLPDQLPSHLVSLANLTPGLVKAILSLYKRASQSARDRLPEMLMVEARIRLTNFFVATSRRRGFLDQQVLEDLVSFKSSHPSSITTTVFTSMGIRKSDIAAILLSSIPDSLTEMSITDLVHILVAISVSLSGLHLQRKQAFYVKALLQRLIPALVEARKVGAAEMGLHPAAALSSLRDHTKRPSSKDRKGIETLLLMAVGLYGSSPYFSPITNVNAQKTATRAEKTSRWSMDRVMGHNTLRIEVLRLCINICEALPDLEGVLGFTVQLLQMANQSLTLSPAPNTDMPIISKEEQIHLLNSIQRTINAGSKLGLPDLRANFWDEFLVRGIEVFKSGEPMKLVSHSSQDLLFATSRGDGLQKDPFIYNPFAQPRSTTIMDQVLVADELSHFTVVLQNPFEFELEIDRISLLAEGVQFDASDHSFILGPLSMQKFILIGTPRSSGTLKITGCTASIRSCYERIFPIFTKQFRPCSQPKQLKLASLDKVLPNQVLEPDVLSLTILPPQPKAAIERTSLKQASLMILEGETRSFDIYLKNESATIPLDFLLFTFQDSVSKQLQEAMDSSDRSPLEMHELQVQLTEKPALKLVSESDKTGKWIIEAGKSSRFTFEVHGRPGLMNAALQVDFGHLGVSRADVKGKFYTRQLLYPVGVTVNGSIEIPRCNVLPYPGTFPRTDKLLTRNPVEGVTTNGWLQLDKIGDTLDTVPKIISRDGGRCLLLLDLRNVWPQPLSITIQTRANTLDDSWTDASQGSLQTVTEVMQPGYVSRIVLLLPRIFIADPHAAIPVLGNQRQFVVSESKLSVEAECASREAFWYREELLKHIKGVWKEQDTSREGIIDFRRGIRLSTRMVDAIKIDEVEIYFSVKPFSSLEILESEDKTTTAAVHQVGQYHFVVPTESFLTLVARVHNQSSENLNLVLRLQPALRDQPHNIALDLAKRFAWSGMLQRALHPALQPGETREVELGITALAEGNFEIGATVEEIKARRPRNMQGHNGGPSTQAERRIWHARQPCLLDALKSMSK